MKQRSVTYQEPRCFRLQITSIKDRTKLEPAPLPPAAKISPKQIYSVVYHSPLIARQDIGCKLGKEKKKIFLEHEKKILNFIECLFF